MPDLKISQFTNLTNAQNPTDILPIVVGAAAPNYYITLNDLFADLSFNSTDAATGWTTNHSATPTAGTGKIGYNTGLARLEISHGGAFGPIASSSGVLTSGRVPYATTNGVLLDNARFQYNGDTLRLAPNGTTDVLQVLTNPTGAVLGGFNSSGHPFIGPTGARASFSGTFTGARTITVPDASGTIQLTTTANVLIPTSTFAGLPTPTGVQMYRLTDTNRGLWYYNITNSQWLATGAQTYNVADFGAKGDGTTDDTAAWQAALDAVPWGGTIVAPPNTTYQISSTLTLSSKQGVTILNTGSPISALGPRFRWTGSGSTLLFLENCYACTVHGFGFYIQTGQTVDTFIKIDSSGGGFSSKNFIVNCVLNAGNQTNTNFRGISIAPSLADNNENMQIRDCLIYASTGYANIRGDAGAMTSGDNTLTCIDATFTVGDVGQVIRVGGAGAAGATLTTTISSFTSATEVELTAAASTTVSNARVHIGQSYGVGIYNANNANAKHQVITNCQILYADKGIHVENGSIEVVNLGGGYCNYGVYFTNSNVEPVVLEQIVMEGNLVEVYGRASRIDMRDCRGSNSYQIEDGFLQLDGIVNWQCSMTESAPPPNGRIFKSLATGNLQLNLINTGFAVSTGGVSQSQAGLDSLNSADRIWWSGKTNVYGLPRDTGIITGLTETFSGYSVASSTRQFLPLASSLTDTNYTTSAMALYAVSSINTLLYGNSEIEITGIFRPDPVQMQIFGTPGGTQYIFSLVAYDASGNGSLRSVGSQIATANATLSASNFIRVTWPAVQGASSYSLYRQNPGNTGEGVLVASGIAGTSYDVVANPGTGYAAWNTLTPPYNQASAIKFRAPLVYPNEITFADNDTTPSVKRAADFLTANTGATSITTFDDGTTGQILRVRVGDSNTTFVNGATLVTGTGGNLTATSGYVYEFILRGSAWRLMNSFIAISGYALLAASNTFTANQILGSNGANSYKLQCTNSAGTDSLYLRSYSAGGTQRGWVMSVNGSDTYYWNHDGTFYCNGLEGGTWRVSTAGAANFTSYLVNRANTSTTARIEFQTAAATKWYVGMTADSTNNWYCETDGGVKALCLNYTTGLVSLQGTTSSFPALKRSSATLQVRLADDSAFTALSLGSLLVNGSTSGVITVQGAAAAGTWALTLPTGAGTAGQFLKTDGAGVSSWANPMGRLTQFYTDAGNSTTTETDLYTFTTAAGQLANNGDSITGQFSGIYVGHATATRQLRVYFAGTALWDSGALSVASNSSWVVNFSITRVSSTTVRYAVEFESLGQSIQTSVGEVAGLTLGNTNILKITGQAAGAGAASNDIVAKSGFINYTLAT